MDAVDGVARRDVGDDARRVVLRVIGRTGDRYSPSTLDDGPRVQRASAADVLGRLRIDGARAS